MAAGTVPPEPQTLTSKLKPKQQRDAPTFDLMALPMEIIARIINEVVLADNKDKDWKDSFVLSETNQVLRREVHLRLRQNALDIARENDIPWPVITFMKRVHDYSPALVDFICQKFDAKAAWRKCGISVPDESR